MINVSKLEYLFRPTPLYPVLRPLLRNLALRQWRATHKPPAPLELKAQFIREHATKHKVRAFVETGTFFGDMLATLYDDFDALTTIELDVTLAEKAKARFRNQSKITVLQGDSGGKLPEVLERLDQPALFWLDGHFSGGVTAKANVDTPVVAELTNLFSAVPLRHAILIDDARLFGTAPDYPSLSAIELLVGASRPGWSMKVELDIICIEPPSQGGQTLPASPQRGG